MIVSFYKSLVGMRCSQTIDNKKKYSISNTHYKTPVEIQFFNSNSFEILAPIQKLVGTTVQSFDERLVVRGFCLMRYCYVWPKKFNDFYLPSPCLCLFIPFVPLFLSWCIYYQPKSRLQPLIPLNFYYHNLPP